MTALGKTILAYGLIAAATFLMFCSARAEARTHRHTPRAQQYQYDYNFHFDHTFRRAAGSTTTFRARTARGSALKGAGVRRLTRAHFGSNRAVTFQNVTGHNSTSLVGIIEPLKIKAEEILAECGGEIVSTHRPGARVRGSAAPSLHASGRAVDVRGDPSCIYVRLRGWRGGYSTDYARVQHVHISWNPGGAEWGARFAHYRGGHTRTYAARRHHHKIRMAGR